MNIYKVKKYESNHETSQNTLNKHHIQLPVKVYILSDDTMNVLTHRHMTD